MSDIITFANHRPIRIADSNMISDVWSSDQDFGHLRLRSYKTKRGHAIYWISSNSGVSYGGHNPKTTRTYMLDAAAIMGYFAEHEQERIYHAEIEALVDASSIVDVDAIV